ncbi:MAG: helix-turn-helix transcriptional regulator [Pseudobutyrivibrio sp.]|uniref:AraC family transcriptional regulator n=1 Tax=Pseudobutyrivibrio sp. TaxID=2014367 RepID=UPI0025DEFF24|nr:AraC family transcriptional regulator [Pseudobutyrivibrio sp.]MBQ6462456.1 helix-turn-helix transcriptional regulator [Pseudobutyrivibrio sp.]
MIETLDGIFETVNYKKSTSLKLYDNIQYEDYPMHWHPALEIVMPVKNGYILNFSNTTVELREQDICFICPGCIHGITAPKTGRRIIFQPNTTYLRYMKEVEMLISHLSPYAIFTPEEYPAIHGKLVEYLEEIREEYLHGTSYSEVDIYSKFLKMLVLIGQNFTPPNIKEIDYGTISREDYASKFLEICDYINAHCTEDLKLNEVADKSGFSKFYFERLFKQFTGVSFYKYVNQKRIARAQELLVEPGNSVTDVALSCGFMSISSFIRMFKLQKGCTPTEFKNMYWSTEQKTMIR